MRVLLIENSEPLVRALKQGLKEEGFAVDVAYDGAEGDYKVRTTDYDAIVFDLNLAHQDPRKQVENCFRTSDSSPAKRGGGAEERHWRRYGLSLLQRWRCDGLQIPVLVLATRSCSEEAARGLDLGADDYMTTPFQLCELLARLRALIRRGHQVRDPVIRVRDLEIDTSTRMVKRAGRSIRLTPREYALLQFLALHQGRVVSRTMIWEHLYDEHNESTSNVVDVYVGYLRTKIDKGFDPPLILTRWGQGYQLRGENE